jgi:hypothetical protein
MKIGNDVMAKKTAGLNAKESQDFERFAKERKKKTAKEPEQEEKISSKLPDREGDASAADLAKQTQELVQEKKAFEAKQHTEIDDIEASN